MEFKKKVNQTNWVDTRKCKCLIFKWILPNQKLESFENWVSRNKVRVPDHSSYDRFEVLKLTRFESGFWICKNFWDISTNARDTDFFSPKRRKNSRKNLENRCFGAISFGYRERKKEEILSAQSFLALGILIVSVNGKWQSNSTNFLPRQ